MRTGVKGCAQRQQAGGAVGQAAVQSLDDGSRLGLGGADAVGRVPARDRQGQGLAQLAGLVSDVAEVGAVLPLDRSPPPAGCPTAPSR